MMRFASRIACLWVVVGQPVHAEDGQSDCQSEQMVEQSIVVSDNDQTVATDQATPSDQSSPDSQDQDADAEVNAETDAVVMVSDQLESQAKEVEEVIEPIARVSDYEPELAEPVLAAEEPNLPVAQVRVTDELVAPVAEQPSPELDVSVEPIATKPRIEPLDSQSPVAGFSGVQPGVSSRSDVLARWGEPDEGLQQTAPSRASTLSYQFDGLYKVRVELADDQVRIIHISLDKPRSVEDLVSCLDLDHVRAATLLGDQGRQVALVYPERGIELKILSRDSIEISEESYTDGGPWIQHMAIRPVMAATFMLRAQNNLLGSCQLNMKDLQQALELDPKSARAFWLISLVRLHIGQAVQAEKLAAQAVELAPREDLYRLHWAKCLQGQARYDEAVKQTRQVLEGAGATPIVRAQALHQMGLLAALGSEEIAQRAVALNLKSIEIADRLATSESDKVQHAAQRLLIDAHLAIALEVARGKWRQKEEYVAQWVARASALAEKLADREGDGLRARLQVAVSALTAVVSLDSPIDPELWLEEATATSVILHESISDELARQQIDWDLGIAYFQAAQIEHRRGNPDRAILYGEKAEALLTPLASTRIGLPDTEHLLGRVYFQLGAVYAVHQEDHVQACQWYDRAADRLLKQVPVTSMAVPGQHGDALVSMGVSYWQTDNRERALELTQAGSDLVEEAVAGGILSVDALAVPYGNLAAMYKAQGEQQPATRYARLASQHLPVKKDTKRR
ncbi:MAG: hypothetical protein ABGX16_24425 [Pirellulales bacterium]